VAAKIGGQRTTEKTTPGASFPTSTPRGARFSRYRRFVGQRGPAESKIEGVARERFRFRRFEASIEPSTLSSESRRLRAILADRMKASRQDEQDARLRRHRERDSQLAVEKLSRRTAKTGNNEKEDPRAGLPVFLLPRDWNVRSGIRETENRGAPF